MLLGIWVQRNHVDTMCLERILTLSTSQLRQGLEQSRKSTCETLDSARFYQNDSCGIMLSSTSRWRVSGRRFPEEALRCCVDVVRRFSVDTWDVWIPVKCRLPVLIPYGSVQIYDVEMLAIRKRSRAADRLSVYRIGYRARCQPVQSSTQMNKVKAFPR